MSQIEQGGREATAREHTPGFAGRRPAQLVLGGPPCGLRLGDIVA